MSEESVSAYALYNPSHQQVRQDLAQCIPEKLEGKPFRRVPKADISNLHSNIIGGVSTDDRHSMVQRSIQECSIEALHQLDAVVPWGSSLPGVRSTTKECGISFLRPLLASCTQLIGLGSGALRTMWWHNHTNHLHHQSNQGADAATKVAAFFITVTMNGCCV